MEVTNFLEGMKDIDPMVLGIGGLIFLLVSLMPHLLFSQHLIAFNNVDDLEKYCKSHKMRYIIFFILLVLLVGLAVLSKFSDTINNNMEMKDKCDNLSNQCLKDFPYGESVKESKDKVKSCFASKDIFTKCSEELKDLKNRSNTSQRSLDDVRSELKKSKLIIKKIHKLIEYMVLFGGKVEPTYRKNYSDEKINKKGLANESIRCVLRSVSTSDSSGSRPLNSENLKDEILQFNKDNKIDSASFTFETLAEILKTQDEEGLSSLGECMSENDSAGVGGEHRGISNLVP